MPYKEQQQRTTHAEHSHLRLRPLAAVTCAKRSTATGAEP
jgi:hypothetical protein